MVGVRGSLTIEGVEARGEGRSVSGFDSHSAHGRITRIITAGVNDMANEVCNGGGKKCSGLMVAPTRQITEVEALRLLGSQVDVCAS